MSKELALPSIDKSTLNDIVMLSHQVRQLKPSILDNQSLYKKCKEVVDEGVFDKFVAARLKSVLQAVKALFDQPSVLAGFLSEQSVSIEPFLRELCSTQKKVQPVMKELRELEKDSSSTAGLSHKYFRRVASALDTRLSDYLFNSVLYS